MTGGQPPGYYFHQEKLDSWEYNPFVANVNVYTKLVFEKS